MVTTKRTGEVASGVKTQATVKICHPSVCVGGAQPDNCVCPATRAK